MAIAQDSLTTKIIESDVTSTSWSHTCSGSNRVLLVFFAVGGDCTPSVSYGGTGLTYVTKVITSGVGRAIFLYRLIAPATGSNTVAVSSFPNGYFKGYAVSITGADQTTPLANTATTSGNSNTFSVDVTSRTGDYVYDGVVQSGSAGGMSFTPGAGQTELVDTNNQAYISFAGSREAGAATTTMSWTSTLISPYGLIGTSVQQIISAPTVTTGVASGITTVLATLAGEVTGTGDGTVSERGICWSLSENPTTGDSKANSGTGTGTYTVQATSLSPGKTYHYRAYCINENSTAYGSDATFTTLSLSGFFNFF